MQSGWYYTTNGEQAGPVAFEALQQMARDGRLLQSDFVWKSGMAGWEPASSVAELWPRAPVRPPPPPPLAHTPAIRTSAQPARAVQPAPTSSARTRDALQVRPVSTGNWIARHWRGELSLPISYWVVGVVLSLVFGLFVLLFFVQLEASGLPQGQAAALIVGLMALMSLFGVWQIVGIWRSAGNHMVQSPSEWRRFWAILARFLSVLGGLQIAFAVFGIIGTIFGV